MKNKKVTIRNFEEYQEYMKAFLLFFDDFCRKNNISYSVFAGTMLGTIRNKGLIPWDGDIDVILTRKELMKLKSAFKHYHGRYHLNYPGNFLAKRTKKEIHPYYCRIIDKKCRSPYFLIDVYTFDYLGNDKEKAIRGIKKLCRLEKRSIVGPLFHLPDIQRSKTIKQNVLAIVCHVFHPLLYPISWLLTPFMNRAINKCEKEYFSFDEDSIYEIVEPTFGRYSINKNILLKSGISDYPFENFSVMCINNYDHYLKTVYHDYMSLPPVEKRVPFPKSLLTEKIKIIIDDELMYFLKRIDSSVVKEK